jgi:hypothetical protein
LVAVKDYQYFLKKFSWPEREVCYFAGKIFKEAI